METISADVAIIGGGVMGCSLAYYLSRKKIKVVLMEKSGIASGASGRAYGMAWVSTAKSETDYRIRKFSMDIYPTLSETLDFDIEFRNSGSLVPAFKERTLELLWEFGKDGQKMGKNISLLDARETRFVEPHISPKIIGSLYSADDNTVNPIRVTYGYARAAQRLGAKIYPHSKVEKIDVSNGAVKGMETNGMRINAPIVVNATGSWGGLTGKLAGLDIPVFPKRLQTLVTGRADFSLNAYLLGAQEVEKTIEDVEDKQHIMAFSSGFLTEEEAIKMDPDARCYVYPTAHKNFIIGEFSNFVGFDTSVTYEGIQRLAKNVTQYVPRMGRLKIIRTYSGSIPYSADTWPFLGFVDEVKGFVLDCGHYAGFGHGPGTGLLLSQLITQGKTDIALDEYNYSRLRDLK